MIINHNVSAINSHRVLKFNNEALNKDVEKLSSG
ncbi:MAG: flagellin, partial [Leptospiraceae bacterium]|nr:flagellin [Leptospiraceae bacterium]